MRVRAVNAFRQSRGSMGAGGRGRSAGFRAVTGMALAVAMAGLALTVGAGRAQAAEPYPGPMRAEVVRVIDADTIRARVKVWPTVEILTTVRLRGVDTPEKGRRARCARERTLASAATRHVRRLLPRGSVVLIRNVRLGKYAGRVLADVTYVDAGGRQRDLARMLIRRQLGRPYRGGHRGGWCGGQGEDR